MPGMHLNRETRIKIYRSSLKFTDNSSKDCSSSDCSLTPLFRYDTKLGFGGTPFLESLWRIRDMMNGITYEIQNFGRRATSEPSCFLMIDLTPSDYTGNEECFIQV